MTQNERIYFNTYLNEKNNCNSDIYSLKTRITFDIGLTTFKQNLYYLEFQYIEKHIAISNKANTDWQFVAYFS